MRVNVKKWGNSASVRIPASVMAAQPASRSGGDVREEDGRVIIEPIRVPAYDLDERWRHEAGHVPRRGGFRCAGGQGKSGDAEVDTDSGDIVWLHFDPQAGMSRRDIGPR